MPRTSEVEPVSAAPKPYAQEVVDLLWPGGRPARVRWSPALLGGGQVSWWVLPGPRSPRLLVPAVRRAPAQMLVRHGDGARNAVRLAVGAAVRSGLARALPLPRLVAGAAGGPLQATLEQVLGHPVRCGVLLGPPRPNRKPVLQVVDAEGRTVAFAKVGTDPATAELVRREVRQLQIVHAAGLREVHPPRVLHAGSVPVPGREPLELLVLEPLASSQQAGRSAFPPPPLAAMAEVAGAFGTQRLPLAGTPFWARTVREPLADVRAEQVRAELTGLADRVERRWGATVVRTGSWHGDWAPWNCGRADGADGAVQVWDWERFSTEALWGLDLVHYLAQQVGHLRADRAEREQELLAGWPVKLAASTSPAAPDGDDEAAQDPDAVLAGYLLALALRFSAGEHAPSGWHPRARWAADLVGRVLARPQAVGAGHGSVPAPQRRAQA